MAVPFRKGATLAEFALPAKPRGPISDIHAANGLAPGRVPDNWAVDFSGFDLNLLRVLDALVATQSVSGAARRLGLSQPATSTALGRLRQTLRDPLLVRDGNRMAPTPLARELGPRLARVLDDLSRAMVAAEKFTPGTTQRRFRVGATDYVTLVLLAPLVARLRRAAPHATLEILPLDDAAEARLAVRELDLVVADRWSLRDLANLETVFHETFVCMARRDHPRLPRRVSFEVFLSEEHALISPSGVSSGVVDQALEDAGRSRRVALTVPHYLAAPAMIAGSDLLITLPRRLAERFAEPYGLRVFRPPVPLQGFDVVVASHSRSAADPAIQWFKQLLRASLPARAAARARHVERRRR